MLVKGAYTYQTAACMRANPVFLNFIKQSAGIIDAKRSVVRHLERVKMIQRKWRCMMQYDVTRRWRLQKAWEEKVNDLANKYNGKLKRQHSIIRKLKQIDPEVRDKALKEYYMGLKMQHLINVTRQLKKAGMEPPSPVFFS